LRIYISLRVLQILNKNQKKISLFSLTDTQNENEDTGCRRGGHSAHAHLGRGSDGRRPLKWQVVWRGVSPSSALAFL
jgi:hypothetical protein